MNVLKSGFLSKFTNSFAGDRWERRWCVLKKDSSFEWFDKQTDSRPKRVVLLKSVCSFLAVGNYARHIPSHPVLGAGHNQHMIIAIPHTASRESKVAFFEASSQQELEEWMSAISSTLPPPPKAQDPVLTGTQPNVIQPTKATSESSPYPTAPPAPGYPGAAPGYPPSAAGYPPSAPGYSAQPGAMPMPGAHGAAPPPYQAPGYPPAGPAGPVGFTVGPGPYPQAPQQPYRPPQPQPGPSNYPSQMPGGYPQQAGGVYPQQGYPQQPYSSGGYGQPAAYGAMAGAAAAPYGQQVVMPRKKKKGKYKQAALGLAGGAAAGYMVGRMTGGFGGWGMGHGWGHGGSWGSWSSGSFGSWGSCGSFGSFGS